MCKWILLFLQVALDSLCKFNATLQLDLPMLPALESEVKRLLRLLGRFITAAAITECGDDLGTTDNMVLDTKLGIGRKARAFIHEPCNIPPEANHGEQAI